MSIVLTPAESRALITRDLPAFIELAFRELNPETPFVPSFHIEAIAAALEKCRLGLITRLIISLPPRSLKSIIASVAFPAWMLGHDPSAKIITASYGQELAEKFARDTRRLMLSARYQQVFPRTRLADRKAVHDVHTTLHGFRFATSVGGALTGLGADIILIDDPLKPDESLSEVARNRVNGWFDNTLVSRLNDKRTGCIIIISQRVHQDDLVGHVLEQGGDWHVLSFPAIAEEDETFEITTAYGRRSFSRKKGEALSPEREPLDVLAKLKRSLGEYHFNAQYQQNPQPFGGNIIKTSWLRYYEERPPTFTSVIQSWDTANKVGDLNDYSVCTTWGVVNGHFYLIDVFRERLNYPELKRAVVGQLHLYRPHKVLIENKVSGMQLIQELQAEGLYPVTAYDPAPGHDKIMRLHAQSARFENGLVLLPKEAPWLDEYRNELTAFPGSKYDDQVDSTAQALHHLLGGAELDLWCRAFGVRRKTR